ncbi:MAG: 16S rRNA (guanine(966)-N(2))-methyltransferase RsmD [Oleiphilaceae bacterium]|nr:16S rRNA (guanine(966)-N(2))-methyltransferase RsmD [Oleiphilaceae bacterium]
MTAQGRKRRRPQTAERGQLRIIGGDWRRRQLGFPAVDGVRPTPDRVRETLFSWLQGHLPGSHCLDLFAGSGVLGLEALSRGAASATFVDQSPRLCQALKENLATLGGGDRGLVVQQSCLEFLSRHNARPGQLVFMDPPYGQGDITALCQSLEQHQWLSERAFVCVEQSSSAPPPVVPAHWRLHRHKSAGQVSLHLYQRDRDQPKGLEGP